MIDHSIYINNLLRQIHPDMKISKDTLSQVNYFIYLLALEIAKQANFLLEKTYIMKDNTKNKKNKKMDARAIQFAVRMILGGELAKHAVSEGVKAISKYNYYNEKIGVKTGIKKSSERVRKEKQCGLVFPISRSKAIIKSVHNGQISEKASIYLAAVLEYITAEITELSGNSCLYDNKKIITPKHLLDAINKDEELHGLIKRVGWDILA